jgi:hypothetical protein
VYPVQTYQEIASVKVGATPFSKNITSHLSQDPLPLRSYQQTSHSRPTSLKEKEKDMNVRENLGKRMAVMLVCGAMLLVPHWASAHCDSLDGPVVNDARLALEKGEIAPVLKWVQAEHEEEVGRAFAQARKVRDLGPEAKTLADRYFFETVVRVHREGEGAAYTGLKPAGTIDPPIAKADAALAAGSVDQLADAISAHVGKAMRERFAHALDARKRADESVQAGREFVEAYVQYVHFVEGIVGVVHGEHAH